MTVRTFAREAAAVGMTMVNEAFFSQASGDTAPAIDCCTPAMLAVKRLPSRAPLTGRPVGKRVHYQGRVEFLYWE